MLKRVRVVALVDNWVRRAGLLAEHGLAFWIETDRMNILWDTGQGHALTENATQLGIDLDTADAVALSHGHFDHTGGLRHFVAAKKHGAAIPRIYLHPGAMAPRFIRRGDPPYRDIGLSEPTRRWLQEAGVEVVWTEEPTAIADDVWLTGTIPRATAFEDTGGPFFLDANCEQPDPLVDDQALFLRTGRGTIVVLGCAHSGTLNTLTRILELTGDAPIRAVLGGMHLHSASSDRLQRTVQALSRLNVDRVVPAHCTGFTPTALLKERFQARCDVCEVGFEWTWEDR